MEQKFASKIYIVHRPPLSIDYCHHSHCKNKILELWSATSTLHTNDTILHNVGVLFVGLGTGLGVSC
jgi:hypothetical protein